VALVMVRVEYKDGRIREYEAAEPDNFTMNDPETDLSFGDTGRAVQAWGSPRMPMLAATPALRLSFRGNPRRLMVIRTERTAAPAEERIEDEHRTVRLGKEAITGGGDGEGDGSAALGEPVVDLA
jgi:hypothetical protein